MEESSDVARPLTRDSSTASGIAGSPSPISRLQTHISFEDLDDFVQMSASGKWDNRLKIAFPSVVLSPDMIVTVCTAIRQSVKTVAHDCNILLDMDLTDAELSDDSFSRILSNAAPMAMRKSGRISFINIRLGGNRLTDRTVEELGLIFSLHRDAKNKYKVKDPIGEGCVVDLARNRLKSVTSIATMLNGALARPGGPLFLIKLENNWLDQAALEKLIQIDFLGIATVCPVDDEDDVGDNNNCCGLSCKPPGKKCRLHVSSDSLVNQLLGGGGSDEDDNDDDNAAPISRRAGSSGFITPSQVEEKAPSIEEMTRALLAGLKITPESSGPPTATKSTPPPLEAKSSSEDISRSLLNLLHASASKLRSSSQVVGEPAMNQNVMNLFNSGRTSGSPVPPASGRSLSEVEALLKSSSSTAASPPVKPKSVTAAYAAVRVPLKVFTPFPGATPLCGLELRVDPLGYRVVRVTEKPGQDGNIKEGDVITAIDGEPLVALPGVAESDREKAIRATFGKRLKDGVQLIIQRPIEVQPSDLNPAPSLAVERKLDFGLMLLGAGIDWRMLLTKLPVAQQQALVICQGLGIEGKLETSPESSPLLVLKGPAGLVDKAMRQFCVVIVKAALLQLQQASAMGTAK